MVGSFRSTRELMCLFATQQIFHTYFEFCFFLCFLSSLLLFHTKSMKCFSISFRSIFFSWMSLFLCIQTLNSYFFFEALLRHIPGMKSIDSVTFTQIPKDMGQTLTTHAICIGRKHSGKREDRYWKWGKNSNKNQMKLK